MANLVIRSIFGMSKNRQRTEVQSQYVCDITMIVEIHVCIVTELLHLSMTDIQTSKHMPNILCWFTQACPITCGGHYRQCA